MQAAERMDARLIDVPRGLANVVVAETELSDVRGLEGFYHYRQYSAVELARSRSVEEVWHLLLDGSLPDGARSAAFAEEIAAATVPGPVADLLPAVATMSRGADALAGLRIAVAATGASRGLRPLLDLEPVARRADLVTLGAVVPTLLASLDRHRAGLRPVPSRPELGMVADYLWMLTGVEAPAEHVSALTRYIVAAIDHGMNASTFTARVIASTGADAASAVVGALGSLSGPLHGGAPSRALDTVDAIGASERTDAWVEERVSRGERIMGFGHPVYRIEDPRSALLKEVALSLGGPRVELAVHIEERIPVVLERLKPGRRLHTNLEWYAAIVMEAIGLDRRLFTPTFALARTLGWTANILEQSLDSKIIRPAARYTGPTAPQPLPDRN